PPARTECAAPAARARRSLLRSAETAASSPPPSASRERRSAAPNRAARTRRPASAPDPPRATDRSRTRRCAARSRAGFEDERVADLDLAAPGRRGELPRSDRLGEAAVHRARHGRRGHADAGGGTWKFPAPAGGGKV